MVWAFAMGCAAEATTPLEVPVDGGEDGAVSPADTPTPDSAPRPDGSTPVDRTAPVDLAPDTTVAPDSAPKMDSAVPDTAPPADSAVPDTARPDTTPRDTAPSSDDPVSYVGSFPARTGEFTATLTVLGERRNVLLRVPTTRPTNPALVLAFHGTNGDGSVMMSESGASALADRNGVVVIAPTSRFLSRPDFDHPAGEETFWETAPNLDVNRNQDLVLVRAIMVEARRVYNIDPSQVYALGHSNGGFFALFVAELLRERIAAFATSSAGLVRCGTTQSCRFTGRSGTCAGLRAEGGLCNCTGPELPAPVPSGSPTLAGYLAHGTDDPLVTVEYTCALDERLRALGHTSLVRLRPGDGHVVPSTFATDAWAFLSTFRR
jgi:poly(3-hydroxybutyrate) depolymerase